MKGKSFAEFSGTVFVMNSCRNLKDESSSWIVDTGATDHMTYDHSLLSRKRNPVRPISICLPDGSMSKVREVGDIVFDTGLLLKGVFLVPSFKQHLLSVGKVLDEDLNKVTEIDKNVFTLQDLSLGKEILKARRITRGLYRAELIPTKDSDASRKCPAPKQEMSLLSAKKIHSEVLNELSFPIMHARLGHVSISKLKHIYSLSGFDVSKDSCDTCIMAKHHASFFPRSDSLASCLFELIYMDVWGPYKAPKYSSARYFVTRMITVEALGPT